MFPLFSSVFKYVALFLGIGIIVSTSLLTTQAQAQEQAVTISGVVREAQSGEFAIGATIALYEGTYKEGIAQKPVHGAVSNKYGFYTLPNVRFGDYTLVVRRIGFAAFTRLVAVRNASERINVEMEPNTVRLQSVSVQAQRERGAAVSTVDVSVDFIKQMPSLGGERDIFRVLQLMPGVKTVSEISSGLYVRGGSPDQNLGMTKE